MRQSYSSDTTTVSNFVKVKDRDAFRDWCDRNNVDFLETPDGRVGYYGAAGRRCVDPEPEVMEDDGDSYVASLLEEGEVLVVMFFGADSRGRAWGSSVAINSQGRKVEIDMQDIYKVARRRLSPRGSIHRAMLGGFRSHRYYEVGDPPCDGGWSDPSIPF